MLCLLISVQDNDAAGGSTLKNKLPEIRESLASDIPSCAIGQANQEV